MSDRPADLAQQLERDYVTRQYHMQVIEALVAERNALASVTAMTASGLC